MLMLATEWLNANVSGCLTEANHATLSMTWEENGRRRDIVYMSSWPEPTPWLINIKLFVISCFWGNCLSSRQFGKSTRTGSESRQRPCWTSRPQETLPEGQAGLRQPAAGPWPPFPAMFHGHRDIHQRRGSRIDRWTIWLFDLRIRNMVCLFWTRRLTSFWNHRKVDQNLISVSRTEMICCFSTLQNQSNTFCSSSSRHATKLWLLIPVVLSVSSCATKLLEKAARRQAHETKQHNYV